MHLRLMATILLHLPLLFHACFHSFAWWNRAQFSIWFGYGKRWRVVGAPWV